MYARNVLGTEETRNQMHKEFCDRDQQRVYRVRKGAPNSERAEK